MLPFPLHIWRHQFFWGVDILNNILNKKIKNILYSTFITILVLSTLAEAAELKCTYATRLGEPFLMRLVSPYPLTDVTVRWLDKEGPLIVAFSEGKYEASMLLGTDVKDTGPGVHELIVIYHERGKFWTLRHDVKVEPKSYQTQELKVPQAMATPPKEVLERIEKESKLVKDIINAVTLRRHWELPLQRPVNGIVTSPYGFKRIYNGTPGNPHRGIDFRAAVGTPVKCAADGVVSLTGDHYFGGKSVYVDHGNGVISCYMHLSEISVKEGQFVQKGEVIALSGQTGRATGPHLHFGLYLLGNAVDPASLF
ncbi:MAG: M23 family metallopeptidase [Acetomicrobium sp.]|nr:M23 family metallopeptidase [Acetomicrobium sp.]